MKLIDKNELLAKYPDCRGLREKLTAAPELRGMAFTAEESAVLQAATKVYGEKMQMIIAIEELSELQKTLCKALRGDANAADIAEEMADVEIMLEQMRMIFDKCLSGMFGQMTEDYKRAKIERLRGRIRERTGGTKHDG